jgi:5'-3' exonuclease
MNGIIHPCSHPENGPKPRNEAEMFNNVFAYVDRLIAITKPQKVVYMAIDGVAPRAKMNQQRSRRFATAKESLDLKMREQKIYSEYNIPQPGEAPESFDSNVITPGTEFMSRLSKALQFYIMERTQSHKNFKHLKIVFSDASVPGEGEHKLLDFIRSIR